LVLALVGLPAIGLAPVDLLRGAEPGGVTPGTRVLLDAHNAYPESGRWADRIDRALATGVPLAIEQDLVWYTEPATGEGRSLVSHGEPVAGAEPTLRDYFFERIRPIVERSLRAGHRDQWPLITLNLDFKSDERAHHRALWNLLGEYESWLCTALRGANSADVQPIQIGPVLVLTGEADSQATDFDDAANGNRLRVFGAVHRRPDGLPGRKTNYRRWWNNSWTVIEAEGQNNAGAWTMGEEQRLASAVRAAHDAGLWIRFYTLDGYDPLDRSGGWSAGYNFGSLIAARERWRAAISAGVDFVAVDQYEAFAGVLRDLTPGHTAEGSPRLVEGILTRAD
jgi:hypothetical protein